MTYFALDSPCLSLRGAAADAFAAGQALRGEGLKPAPTRSGGKAAQRGVQWAGCGGSLYGKAFIRRLFLTPGKLRKLLMMS